MIDGLLDGARPRPDMLSLTAALAYDRPLQGSIARWAGRLEPCPRPLAARVVRHLGQIDHFWRWQMYIERGDPHGLRIHVAGVVTALTHVLCALNGRWWPGPKWPGWTLVGLPLAPPHVLPRIRALDALHPAEAAAELEALVEQAYDLVAAHLPEADPDRLREIFRFSRPPWPPPVPDPSQPR